MSELNWNDIVNNVYVQIVTFVAFVGALAAFLNNIKSIGDKVSSFKAKRKKRKEEKETRKEMPLKTFEMVNQMRVDYSCIAGTVKEQQKVLGELSEAINELRKQNAEQNQSINAIKDNVGMIDMDTGDILCSQLTREHDYYMLQGYCSSADKHRISSIFDSYKKRGRNHLAERFFDDVLDLPEQ